MRIRNILIAAIALCGFSASAQAEENEKNYYEYPHMFVGVQGGMQTTFTDFDQSKLITPTTSVSFGAMFTRAVGLRLHINGGWNKGGVENYIFDNATVDDVTYKYNYITTNVDLMLNLLGMAPSLKTCPWGLYVIGGIGLNTAWNNDDARALGLENAWKGTKLSHNARVGIMAEYNINKLLALNLEVDANSLSDKYNSKYSNCDDWSLTAQVGLAFKFGYKKKPVVVPEEIWATRIDTIWYEEPSFKERVENGTISWNVFYEIRESDFNDPDAKLAAIGAFLKDHRECKISLKSYADVQTGNPKINMKYSQQRSEKAVQALLDAGVDASAITAEYFGDTVQPFAENDRNRVTIITATGLKDVKDQIKVKKFRTEEVRYRVQ